MNLEWLVVGKVGENLGEEKGVVLVLSILVMAISQLAHCTNIIYIILHHLSCYVIIMHDKY